MRSRVLHRTRQAVIGAYVLALLGCVAMLVGPWLNDRTIEQDPGRALATVTGVTTWRTTVEYQDEQGMYHLPATGLLYPSGLGEGQNVWVTYARTDPDLVKVEGREWTLAVVPAASVALAATLLAGLWWWAAGVAFRSPKVRDSVT
ncbi:MULTISPECIES: DUF3592 domain-containing protein [unclassified Corynebacterium]|uniref:DUF3592 domain-containing protein n=1 Tax=unclassified Corynebacterium TaxID=2624378 RepID=UPI0029CA4A0B|nr:MULTISPECIES: DUF3592 domain-containing protein [unclassified Corynebacterium]WPF66440.1 DUF3592 domain-containing protein [Corynebacterium sp. 22KM0430]WPF68930.1 DUF3592 domain-containing protein [Corynebacterium sp. 21KM1197]